MKSSSFRGHGLVQASNKNSLISIRQNNMGLHQDISNVLRSSSPTLRHQGTMNTVKRNQSHFATMARNQSQEYLSNENRKPSLPMKIEILNKWFSKAANGKNFMHAELTPDEIAEFFVNKGLISDRDTGVKQILKSLNIKEKDKEKL